MKERFTNNCNAIGYIFLVLCIILVSVPFPLCSFIPALVPVVPVLVCGGIISGAVGAVHAGWRGTAADIAGKAVKAMASTYGCDPKNIRAAIGPNIGQCCFETDAEVPEAMLKAYGNAAEEFIRPAGIKSYVNLKGLNALSLRNAGVTHIAISSACTACEPDRFWSHRVTRGVRGSQGAIIVCKEVME